MRNQGRGLKALRFHDLTPYRVREVLLVSSPYDAFILEEDGQLTEQVFFEYRKVSASSPPRFTHVRTDRAAFAALRERRFDLILVMASLSGMGVNAFGRRVKELRPGRPVVFLAIDDRELDQAREAVDPEVIDGTFLWRGDPRILLAITKYIEDRENVEHDVAEGNIRVILMIEDSPRFYSAFFGLLYKELMSQSRSLASEGVNELHRMMYMRARPKILHATSYERGKEIFDRYESNVMALISDVAVPRGDEVDSAAGVEFTKYARGRIPDLPVLLHSADPDNAEIAQHLRAAFAHKGSPTLLAQIRAFLTEQLGFGDFVFRLPDGREVGRARDLLEMEQVLPTVSGASVGYHASNNHFSIWLMARCEFELADRLRPRKTADFGGVEETREHLLKVLSDARRSSYEGQVADLNPDRFDQDLITRTGPGALGGKARGIAFLNRVLNEIELPDRSSLPVEIPKTVVVTTDTFDAFLDGRNLREFASNCEDDVELARKFLSSPLPQQLDEDLRLLVERLEGPLAVRSSSLLEDSLHQPFAGIYSTLMIPNNDPDPERRLESLAGAIKLVYASTFSSDARSYLSTTGHLEEEEKMAVIVQPLIGRRHGDRFYPTFSGVAQSFNFYPVGAQRGKDGVVHVAVGLGRMVVDGGLALRFSPRNPGILPQFAAPTSMLDRTQRSFYAVDMEYRFSNEFIDPFANVREFDLIEAEADGALSAVASVYVANEQQLREDLSLAGPRVVTFANILKHGAVPLAETLQEVIKVARRGMGGPVEVEFACEMGDWGRRTRYGKKRVGPVLYLLQMRPLGSRTTAAPLSQTEYARKDVVCASHSSLGQGLGKVRDVVYVRRDRWRASKNKVIAREIEQVNRSLLGEKRRYLLVGPGRWGTADEWLGIPVKWRQISNAKVIVEASPKGYNVEPSQGTHFFQNITSLRIGYLTVPSGAEKRTAPAGTAGQYVDWEWLDSRQAHAETEHLRHVRLRKPLTVVLDGREGRGLIVKPGRKPIQNS
ncbi:MAG: PEP/pyruvate-binding domain-containing protein [Thermoanaerobaculia bacterium]